MAKQPFEFDPNIIDPKTKQPATSAAGAKRAQKHRQFISETNRGNAKVRPRKNWEQGEGAERMKDASALLGTDAPVGLIYQTRGWSTNPDPINNPASSSRPRHYDRQIPGLEDPDAIPDNPRWEDLDDKTRADAERKLKAEAGVDLDFMIRSVGAQIDQSYARAESHLPKGEPTSAAVPYTRDFYDETTGPNGEVGPLGVMEKGAAAANLRFGQYAALSAITSPSTHFQKGDRYPNDETAQAAAFQAHSQDALTAEMPRRRDDPSKQAEGRPANFRKAVDAAQQFNEGVPVSAATRNITEYRGDRKRFPEGEAPPLFDPPKAKKTVPYHNSWLKSSNPPAVIDVHTAGAGLPHLSTDKPIRLDEKGNPMMSPEGRPLREKSAREKVLEKSGLRVHEMMDYAMRQAMQQRGLGSTRRTQAAQWGEERLQRKEKRPQFQGPTGDQAYAHLRRPKPEPDPNQERLF